MYLNVTDNMKRLNYRELNVSEKQTLKKGAQNLKSRDF